MVKTFQVQGMHCMSCVSKIEKAFYSAGGFNRVEVNLETNTLTLDSPQLPADIMIAEVLNIAGDYTLLSDLSSTSEATKSSFWVTYKPLLLIAFFLVLVSSIAASADRVWDTLIWMHTFMGGFFLVFSFFKLLDIEGFARAFKGYDLVAGIWPGYSKLYPFLEMMLGIAYLMYLDPVAVNTITLVVMGSGALGVANSLLKKQQIQCACLGTVFKLPMSTVTLVEDLLMVIMAIIMLFT